MTNWSVSNPIISGYSSIQPKARHATWNFWARYLSCIFIACFIVLRDLISCNKCSTYFHESSCHIFANWGWGKILYHVKFRDIRKSKWINTAAILLLLNIKNKKMHVWSTIYLTIELRIIIFLINYPISTYMSDGIKYSRSYASYHLLCKTINICLFIDSITYSYN